MDRRRLIRALALTLALLAPACAEAGSVAMMAGGGVPAAECGAINTHSDEGSNGLLGSSVNNEYLAASFTAAASASLKTLYVKLKDVGSPTSTITVAICTDTAGSPTETCTNADATLAGNTTTGTYAEYKFNWAAGYAVTASTRYHVRLHTTTADASNYHNVSFYGTGGETVKSSPAAFSWTNVDSTSQLYMRTTSCAE